jgi:hypothetical protein
LRRSAEARSGAGGAPSQLYHSQQHEQHQGSGRRTLPTAQGSVCSLDCACRYRLGFQGAAGWPGWRQHWRYHYQQIERPRGQLDGEPGRTSVRAASHCCLCAARMDAVPAAAPRLAAMGQRAQPRAADVDARTDVQRLDLDVRLQARRNAR